MKKLIYLIVLTLILGLVLTGCLLSNVGQVPTSEQSGANSITKSFTDPICIDFETTGLSEGASVEGMATIDSLLNIDLQNASKSLILLMEGTTIYNFTAYNTSPGVRNGCLNESYGFGCTIFNADGSQNLTNALGNGDKIVFTFPAGVTVSNFSLWMFDYGDWYPVGGTPHKVRLTGDDGSILEYLGPSTAQSPGYDACAGVGKQKLEISGIGISEVTLEFVNGIDPGVGFDDICFTIDYVPLPSIEIVKTAEPTMIHAGDEVIYTYVVTNTGSLDLVVDVSDDVLGSIVSGVNLAAGASETYTNFGYPTSDTTNIGTATGTDMFGQVTESNDDASVDVLNPVIKVEKSGPDAAFPGTTVTYSYTVTNVGDCTLYDVSLVDDVVGTIVLLGLTNEDGDGIADDLAQGASATGTADYLVTFDDPEWLENTATAEGTDELGLIVDDEASWTVHTMGARSIGYWKNHSNDWCDFPSGSMFNGETWGALSQFFPGSGAQADGVNPLEMLRAQLIAAELNYACFEEYFHYARYEAADIFGTMRDAEALLQRVYLAASDDLDAFWSSLSKKQQNNVKQIANPLKDTLEEFNEMGDEIFE